MVIVVMLTTREGNSMNTTDTRLMHQPAISATHIAFIYANDLWCIPEVTGVNSQPSA